MAVKEYLSFTDLEALDSSPDKVRNAFEGQFNSKPAGICLNHDTYYDAVKPAITEQYGHWCYKRLGEYQFAADSKFPPESAVVGSNTAVNQGDTEAEISLTVNASWSESTGYSSSITSGMTFNESFGVEGVFSMGMSFSMEVTAGQSKTNTETKSASSSVSVKVPPMSKVKVSMVGTMKKESLDFTAPIDVSGEFGANFSSTVDGHYFWFLPASTVLPKTSGEIKGTITGTKAFDVHTIIGKAEPI